MCAAFAISNLSILCDLLLFFYNLNFFNFLFVSLLSPCFMGEIGANKLDPEVIGHKYNKLRDWHHDVSAHTLNLQLHKCNVLFIIFWPLLKIHCFPFSYTNTYPAFILAHYIITSYMSLFTNLSNTCKTSIQMCFKGCIILLYLVIYVNKVKVSLYRSVHAYFSVTYCLCPSLHCPAHFL